MPKRRNFAAKQHQLVYDELRTMRPDPERVRGMGGGGNAYAVGYTQPDEPNHLFPRGSRAYVHWAAGVDNARDDAKRADPTVRLSPGEERLIDSIIEHIYPEPKEGTALPVAHDEKRAARGLERKGLVVLGLDPRGFDEMKFTALGRRVYELRLAVIHRHGAASNE